MANLSTNNFNPNQAISVDTPTTKDATIENTNVDLVEKRVVVDDMKRDENARHRYMKHIFMFTMTWCIAMLIILLLAGYNFYGFHLNDTVLIAFITTTTATVFGLIFIAAKWLFPNNGTNS